MTEQELVKKVLDGDQMALAKAITLVCSHLEKDKERASFLLRALMKNKKESFRIGVSGVGGVGKSTFVGALGEHILKANVLSKVAVLTVDPSSPKAGGSILGDLIRMGDLASLDRAFIRSIANKGLTGGVVRGCYEVVCVLEAAGFDYILIESTGVGQSDKGVASVCDLFVSLQMPGTGDGVQALKKGANELADFIVIHKHDGFLKNEAEKTQVFYKQAQNLQKAIRTQDQPEVVLVSSLEKKGIGELWGKICQKEASDKSNLTFKNRRSNQLLELFEEELRQVFQESFSKSSYYKKHKARILQDFINKDSTPLVEARSFVRKCFSSLDV